MKRVKSKRKANRNVIDHLERRMMLSVATKSQIPSPTLQVGGSAQTVNLSAYFNDAAIPSTDTVIEIQTNLPSPDNLIPVELTTAATPNTVQNFLNYIANGDYANTIIHRSVPGFIIQGGGYKATGTSITPLGTIKGESSTEVLNNSTGTIAMALSTGPNSGTSEWFFNLSNNPFLDGTQDGGPFTVFGQVIYQGLTVIDDIGNLPVVDDTGDAGGAWSSSIQSQESGQQVNPFLPVQSGTNNSQVSTEAQSNLVQTTPVIIPGGLVYPQPNVSNTSVVTASITQNNLTITPVGVGTTSVTIEAVDLGLGHVFETFNVTVDSTAAKPAVFVGNANGTVGTNSQINFPITLSNASSSVTTLHYALTAGTASASDYQVSGSTLNIPAGATTASIPVTLVKDSTGKSETFSITLSSLSSNAVFGNNGTTESAAGVINPAGTISTKVAIENAAGTVGTNSQILFPVTLSASSTSATTLSYTLTANSAATSDYSATGSTLTIPAGSTSADIPVTVIKDSTSAPETFSITLTNLSSNAAFLSGTSSESAVGTINPSGTISSAVSIADASGTVGNDSQIVFPVTLSASSTSDVTLDYALTAGTAGSSDFAATGTSLTIPAGSTTASIPVTLVGDTSGAAETFTITLSNLSSNAIFASEDATETATGTINPAAVVGPATTTTALTASTPAVPINGAVILTATVTPASTGDIPTGTVTFENAGVSIGTGTLTNGLATLSTTLSTPGNVTFTAVYGGDTANLTSTSGALTVNVATISPAVSKSTLPTAAVGGAPVKGTTTVGLTNDTSTVEKGKVTVKIYASSDGVIDTNSVLVATVTRSVNIKAGKAVNVPVPVTSFPATLGDGTYTLLAQTVNTSGQISNSTSGPTITLAAPFVSLTESFVKLVQPASVVAGSKTSAVAVLKITNRGNIASTGLTAISLYASTDGTVANGTLIKTLVKKLSIKPGKSANISVPLGKYPLVADGSYTIVAQVTDPKGNLSGTPFGTPVNIAAAFLNLVSAVASVPATGTIGKGITVVLEVTNNGNTPAVGALDVQVSGSSDSAGDNPFTLATLTEFLNLKPGAKRSLRLVVPLPHGTPAGVTFMVVNLVSDNVFGSSDWTNPTSVSATAVHIS